MCPWDVWNVGSHALHPSHNWSKVFGPTAPALTDIEPYLKDVLKNAAWTKVSEAHGPGGKVLGDILEAASGIGGLTIWVRGFRRASDGKVFVNNGGVR